MRMLKKYLNSKETRKYAYIAIVLIAILSFALYLKARSNRIQKSKRLCESAIVIMEEGDFQDAIPILNYSLSMNRQNAQAHYALAVSLMRQKEPDIKAAIKHKRIAQRLGYVVPKWFDDYLKMLSSKQ